MDIALLAQRLFRFEIRRLLLILGLIVCVIVVSQCFSFPYGNVFLFSYARNGSTVVNVVTFVNASTSNLNNSEPTEVYDGDFVAHGNEALDLDGENGSEIELEHEDNDHELADDNDDSHKNFIFEKGVSGESDFSLKKETDSKHNSTDESYRNSTDLTKSMSSSSSEVRNQDGVLLNVSQGIFKEDIRNLDADSVGNVSQTVKAQPNEKKTELWKPDLLMLNGSSKVSRVFISKTGRKKTTTISQMNSIFLQSSLSSRSMRPQWSSVRDRELLAAKQEIQNAPIIRESPELSASIFRNVSTFKRSYELMERRLKVYIYKEGKKPIFHQPYMRGIYASEGWFMKLMERNKKFVVRDPKKAHLFYLPFSSKILRYTILGKKNLEPYLTSYVKEISGKYRFWNRTGGADHFFVGCHDWASWITRKNMNNCIRALCNADVSQNFKIGKDTSLPVTYIRSTAEPLENVGGKPASKRSILAFFAGGMHGYLRPILLHFWENKQPDMKIIGPMPHDIEGKKMYREYMKSSKYCICARGYEVHTPRVVEAIYYECVPVFISDNYVPPFFEVLNWEEFSVFVQEKDIPNLRNILLSIPEEKYAEMQSRVKKVQKHFFWHKEPIKYDLFHMVLHSIWYNRVLQVKTR
ncbi:hypothetical protein UlMin_022206 [Ulmus minor]